MSNPTTPADTRTDQENALWQALAAAPGASAIELGHAASQPKTAVRKILNQWAADGLIVRANNGDDRNGFRWRIADQHAPTETGTTTTEPDPQPAAEPTPAEPVPATDAATGDTATAPDSPSDTAAADPQPATDSPSDTPAPAPQAPDSTEGEAVVADAETPAGEGDSTPGTTTPTLVNGVCPTCGQPPKRQPRESQAGVLRGKVEDYLRENPTEEFTPGQIAKALGGKSSGAVYNACFALVGKFVAEYTCERPNKFRLHPDQAKQQAQEAAPHTQA
ncbi:MarR family transcriptional regulator [Nocardia sp. ET3-3]|uniref:MarR family transcriptional regulator n=1 Tax=Nocardia terrae TaxID=2675851 RepID=A0A7K1US05_9NOCA|nr:MarR family transcriptional regulator [Nocardia terrae]MVU77126.1 MarR family transcriptional regulator [Nocardia terrae]